MQSGVCFVSMHRVIFQLCYREEIACGRNASVHSLSAPATPTVPYHSFAGELLSALVTACSPLTVQALTTRPISERPAGRCPVLVKLAGEATVSHVVGAHQCVSCTTTGAAAWTMHWQKTGSPILVARSAKV